MPANKDNHKKCKKIAKNVMWQHIMPCGKIASRAAEDYKYVKLYLIPQLSPRPGGVKTPRAGTLSFLIVFNN